MTTIYFWTILVFLLLLVGVAIRGSRQVASQEDFSVAGRKLSSLVLFGTMLATWIGTGSIFGNAEKTYRVGVAAVIIPLAALAGIVVLYFLAGRARGLRGITVQDLLERRYNATARVFGTVTLVLAYVTIVSYQYRAAGAVLNLAVPELSNRQAILITTVFIIAYTALAGMVSIANIGLIQGIVMILGVTVALPVFWFKAGGLTGMRQVLNPSHFDLFGPISFLEGVGILLPAFLLILGDANMYQRFFSARSEGSARQAVLWLFFGVAFMETAIILTAWVASSLVPELDTHGQVIAYAARDHLPVVLGALLLTTIMAIILSTAGSYLLSPATCVIRDIYQRFLDPQASERRLVVLLRLLVVVLGGAAYYLSTLSNEFLSVALYAYTIYGAGITPALIAAFFWRRANASGAIASILSGTAVAVSWKLLEGQLPGIWGQLDAVVPAIGASVLALVLVSLVTSSPSEEQVAPFFELS